MRLDEGEHVDELIAPYVLGALEPDEVEAVELHLQDCDWCRMRIAEERQVTSALPYLAEPQPVPLRARRALIDRIEHLDADSQTPARGPWRLPARVARLSWAAAAVAAVIALVFAWNSYEMQSQVEKTEAEKAVAVANQEVLVEATLNKGSLTDFNSSGAAAGAEGGVVLNPVSNTALVLVRHMPQAKNEHSYVVWLLRGDQHVNGGMLVVDENGNGQLPISPREALASFDGIVITEEPGPLVAQPTGVRLMTAWVDGE